MATKRGKGPNKSSRLFLRGSSKVLDAGTEDLEQSAEVSLQKSLNSNDAPNGLTQDQTQSTTQPDPEPQTQLLRPFTLDEALSKIQKKCS